MKDRTRKGCPYGKKKEETKQGNMGGGGRIILTTSQIPQRSQLGWTPNVLSNYKIPGAYLPSKLYSQKKKAGVLRLRVVFCCFFFITQMGPYHPVSPQPHCTVNTQRCSNIKENIYQSITHQSSFILFWRMVPVRPMRTRHFNDFMVWVIWAFGFLILCASSTITADHSILQIKKRFH